MSHITYLEASVVGLIQGVTELFPVSSLGHNVLIPALIGGSWATDLNVAAPESPYLAFIVGLHVATALALLIYFWRDWVRIIGGFFSSLRDRRIETVDQKLAWMIILATIPVGLVGLVFEHEFRVLFAKPIRAAIFLIINGLILFAGEKFRTRRSLAADAEIETEEDLAERRAAGSGVAMHASGQRAVKQLEASRAVQADQRLTAVGYLQALIIGSSQILALLAGISRDGVVMVTGMFRGLSRQDAARFSFLLSTPVILAAGVLKIPDLTGPLGKGIHGQVIVGSILSGVGAYLSVRFLMKYFQTKTLTPFAIYCVVAGLASVIYLSVK
ncbi:MAG TPA: undecaprenyl-diphosphate phosphatase [Streptosporangiaceae bacterium]|jgi:undecaprenyl-diphosphatase